MPLFQLTQKSLKPIAETTFGAHGIMERKDLQRLLREQINVLGDNLMVVAEEFGEWVDSSRRIDLLCIDVDANLVVVELKRTEDGGHMELQALRYAAMVARMTFEQLVNTYASFRNKAQPDLDAARAAIHAFIGLDGVEEDEFVPATRIVLAAADFGKELTTCVMWLNEFNLDIRCVRLKPYRMDDGTVLLDVDQIIPLPETAEYQTQIGAKKQAEQEGLAERHVLRIKFWEALLSNPKIHSSIHASRNPTTSQVLGGSSGRGGFYLNYVALQHKSRAELWITAVSGQTATNKVAFNALLAHKTAIEQDFGGALDWQELPASDSSRICIAVEGGYRSPVGDWPTLQTALIDAMSRLDKAMRPRVAALSL